MTCSDALFDLVMYPLEAVSLAEKRRELLPRAHGDVLELGAGTGVNVPYYDTGRVESLALTDLEPTERLHERANELRGRAGLDGAVRVQPANAESLPFAADSFDTVVFTLVFCSVDDQARGLSEVRRVLRPGGTVVFIEHVRPPGAVRHAVDALNPVWHTVTGECNINRDTAAAIREAGLEVERLQTSGRGFLIHGVAREPALE